MNPINMTARILALASCLCLSHCAVAADGINGNLVSVEWLQKNIGNPDVLLLDASPAQLYMAKHMPGAVNVDVISFGGREVPLPEMESRMQSWGVGKGRTIVIYDQGGTFWATSLFFDLYYHGFPAAGLFVLDGGLSKWQAAGGTVTKDPTPTPAKGSFRIAKLHEEVRVRLPEFLVASGDPANNALLEALEANYHFGGAKFFDRTGHVPNAINLPNAEFFNPDKTFKSAAEIQRMMDYLGVKPEQQILSHCGGGIAASVPFFATKFMLSYPRVKLYKESQLEWLRDDRGLPFWTYDAPAQLREKQWLNGWGGQMMRMFGVAKLSVVDVRSAESFKLGHVPFALNIPADVFRSHLANPAKLAEILGAAGVDAAHEAVIVSEGGLNANSALAFLMLEKLGQRKVSVLTDSVDDWGLGGLPLTKDATVVGPRKSAQDMAIPPTVYPVSVRKEVIIADPKSTQGVFPKVFIASGKNVPARAQDGKVVHIPYTELLNADGTPKAAKDIWAILAKAGVPRYAELVCYSDDPGEAAANYFILKLMGYPDIKVLVS
jgi:3-mercaptopyruvate sulfurtransferase SseA